MPGSHRTPAHDERLRNTIGHEAGGHGLYDFMSSNVFDPKATAKNKDYFDNPGKWPAKIYGNRPIPQKDWAKDPYWANQKWSTNNKQSEFVARLFSGQGGVGSPNLEWEELPKPAKDLFGGEAGKGGLKGKAIYELLRKESSEITDTIWDREVKGGRLAHDVRREFSGKAGKSYHQQMFPLSYPESQKAKGFVPGFAKDPNRLREAQQSGLDYADTYNSFVNTSKYSGPVVGNKRDEPTQQALRAAVMGHPDPANAGRYGDGFTPGFAESPGSTDPMMPIGGDLAAVRNEMKGMFDAMINESASMGSEVKASFEKMAAESLSTIDQMVNDVEVSFSEIQNAASTADEGMSAGVRDAQALEAGARATEDVAYKQWESDLGEESKAFTQKIRTENVLSGREAQVEEQRGRLIDRGNALVTSSPVMEDYEGGARGGTMTGMAHRVQESFEQNRVDGKKVGVPGGSGMFVSGVEGKQAPRTGKDISKLQDMVSTNLHELNDAAIQMAHEGKSIADIEGHVAEGLKKMQADVKQASASMGGAAKNAELNENALEVMHRDIVGAKGDTGKLTGKRTKTTATERARRSELETMSQEGRDLKVSEGKRDRTARRAQEREAKFRQKEAKTGASSAKHDEAVEAVTRATTNTTNQTNKQKQQAKELATARQKQIDAVRASAKKEVQGMQRQLGVGTVDQKVASHSGKTGVGTQQRHAVQSWMQDKLGFGGPSEQLQADKKFQDVASGRQGSFWGQGGSLGVRGAKGQSAVAFADNIMTREGAQQATAEAKAKRNEKLQAGGMAFSFVAPMISSSIANMSDDAGTKAAAEGVGDVAMWAGMGAQFGGPGAAVGAAIGGVMAVEKVLKANLTKALTKTKEKAEEASVKLQNFANTAQSYIQAAAAYDEAAKKGTADPEELRKRSEQMKDAFMDIPTEFRSKMAGAAGNVKKIQEIFAEIQKDLQKTAEQISGAANLGDKSEKQKSSSGILRGLGIGDEALLAGESGLERQLLVKSFTDQMKLMMNKDKLKTKGSIDPKKVDKLLDVASKASSGDRQQADFIRKVSEIFGTDMGLQVQRDVDQDSSNLGDYVEMIKSLGRETKNGIGFAEQQIKAQQQQSLINSQLAASLKRLNTHLANTGKQIELITSILASRMASISEGEGASMANRRSFDLTNIRGGIQASEPFMDDLAKQNITAAEQFLRAEVEGQTKFEAIQRKLLTSVINSVGSEVSKLAQISASEKQATEPELTTDITRQRQIGIRNALNEVLKDVGGAFAGGGRDPEAIAKAIKESMGRLVTAGDINVEQQKAIEQTLVTSFQSNKDELVKLGLTMQKQLAEQAVQSAWQQQIAENSKMLKQFGGIDAFVGGNKVSKDISEIFNERVFSRVASKTPSIDAGKADLKALNMWRNVMGASSGSSIPQEMRERAVQATKTQMDQNVSFMIQANPELQRMLGEAPSPEALKDAGIDTRAIAETQVSGMLRDDQGKILSDIRKIMTELPSKTLDQKSAQTAMTNALNDVLGNKSNYIVTPLNEIQKLIDEEAYAEKTHEAKALMLNDRTAKRAADSTVTGQWDSAKTGLIDLLRGAGLLNKDAQGKEVILPGTFKSLFGVPLAQKNGRSSERGCDDKARWRTNVYR